MLFDFDLVRLRPDCVTIIQTSAAELQTLAAKGHRGKSFSGYLGADDIGEREGACYLMIL